MAKVTIGTKCQLCGRFIELPTYYRHPCGMLCDECKKRLYTLIYPERECDTDD